MIAGLFRSTAVIGSMTFLSRILGFIRDVVIAGSFGASMATDAFFVAFKLPNFFRRLFAEGAFATAFVPVFTDYRQQGSHRELQELLGAVTGILGAVVAGIALIGVLAAPLLIWLLAPGFGDEPAKLELATDLLRITFPYLFFVSLVALAGGVLNTFDRFAAPAFTPVLLNLAMITGALWGAPHLDRPIAALAWAVFAGGVLQLAFQWPFLRRLHLLVWPRFQPHHPGVRRIIRLMAPSALSAGVTQVSLLIDTFLASLLAEGSVSYLYYSDRLVQFPLGLLGIALATALLPTLSFLASRGEEGSYSETLDRALRLIVTLAAPATAGLLLLGRPILATLFQYGAFTAEASWLTYQSLVAYACGLVGFIGVKVLAPAFYARQDPRTPLRIAAKALGANMVLNLLLIQPLAHAGLALATSLAACLNAGLLLRELARVRLYRPGPGWGRHLFKVAAAVMALAGIGWVVTPAPSFWDEHGILARVAALMGVLGAGGGGYLLVAWLLGVDEIRRAPSWLAGIVRGQTT